MNYEHFMVKALDQAKKALAEGEFPVGCVMVHQDKILATGSRKGTVGDFPNEIDHAEMIALKHLIDLKVNMDNCCILPPWGYLPTVVKHDLYHFQYILRGVNIIAF